jgi:hypothetical protein
MGNKVEGTSNTQDTNGTGVNVNSDGKSCLNEDQIKQQRLAYLERKIAENSSNNKSLNTGESSKMDIEIDENLVKEQIQSQNIVNQKLLVSNNSISLNNNTNSNLNNNIVVNNNGNNNTNNNNFKKPEITVKQEQVNKINSTENKQQPQQQGKVIDFEHVAIEKIFKITLEKEKSDKLMYLENYSKGLTQLGKENKFRVNDLDNLIILLIDLEKDNIIDFFLTSFHRAYELIEVKFKKELQEKFSETLKLIASYFSMVLTYSENFDISLVYENVEERLAKYINETVDSNEEEVLKLFTMLFMSTEDNEESMKCVFNYIINIINRQNIKCFLENKSNVSKIIYMINTYTSYTCIIMYCYILF